MLVGGAESFGIATVSDGLDVGVMSRGRHPYLLRHQQRLLLVVYGKVTLVLAVGFVSAVRDIVVAAQAHYAQLRSHVRALYDRLLRLRQRFFRVCVEDKLLGGQLFHGTGALYVLDY